MNFAALSALSALSAALLLILPCAAVAQEQPEAVYAKYHHALLTGNFEEAAKHVTAEGRKKINPMSAAERDSMKALLNAFLPQSYSISGKEPGPDGKTLTMHATGMGKNLLTAKPEAMTGVIRMVKEGSDWKVEKPEWNDTNQHGMQPRAPNPKAGTLSVAPQGAPQRLPVPAKSTAPKTPARVVGIAKEPCVYKPVMTNEDMDRCR